MIKKRTLVNGVNANVSLEPSAASQSTSNINNNIIINKREDGKEEIVITRDAEIEMQEEKYRCQKCNIGSVCTDLVESRQSINF